ncbi:hypothetical protein TUMSATVNIG1_59490 (plasmid) [Vibrio nigripulchritudo]|uniref:hypothetical protein n=1 Tax=Vibrio nigripulchritudo TaxID=28173 RepID=UPI00190C4FE1|nr:hypothetical protein [Vibrio nigripulchritudo]BCL73963.1 hypothetical protein VNTUMSATTG_59000 [Vibrio nigripulchritudo]BDU35340.1 hypothetical protein TUMSATVNIG1_59490 [Vibrio nigripulchritudo]
MSKTTGFGKVDRRMSAANPRAGATLSARQVKLPSGKVITLRIQKFVGAEEIERRTFVHEENPRDQDKLNEEELKEWIEDFKNDLQILPALGYLDSSTDKVGIIDGSTRRFCAIKANGSFTAEVSDQPISKEDAIFIVDKTQQARKLSAYDYGQYYKKKFDLRKKDEPELSQRAFAKELRLSQTTLSRFLKAAALPQGLYDFFGTTQIGTESTKTLIKIYTQIESEMFSIGDLMSRCEPTQFAVDAEDDEDIEKAIRDALDAAASELALEHQKKQKSGLNDLPNDNPSSPRPSPESLWTGEKSAGITFKQRSKSNSSIAIKGVSQEKLERIKSAIKEIMNQ